jgi:hypothetical protein
VLPFAIGVEASVQAETTKENPMANQTKADRREAAQKAAATRRRNEIRQQSREQGTKAASSRQANEAAQGVRDARSSLAGAASGVGSAGRSVAGAAAQAGKATVTRVLATLRGAR